MQDESQNLGSLVTKRQERDVSTEVLRSDGDGATRDDDAVAIIPNEHSADPLAAEVDRLQRENEQLRAAIAQRDTRIACIQEIGAALGSTISLDELLNVMMEKITVLMEADRSTLFLLDESRDVLWSKVIQGETVSEIRLAVGEGIAGWVGASGQSINIRDAYEDSRFNQEVDLRTGYRTRSILCQPIRNQEREIIGVVQVLNKHDGHFTVEDENLLSSLASQIAVSIENSMLYMSVVDQNLELMETKLKLEKKVREMDLLYNVQTRIGQALGLEDLIQLAANRVLDVVDAEVCAVAIAEQDHLRTFTLQRTYEGELDDDDIELIVGNVALGTGIAGIVIDSGEHYLDNDIDDTVATVVDTTAVEYPARNVLAVPFFADGEVIGAMELINKIQPDGTFGFDNDDVKLITLMAGQIGKAVATTLHREQEEKANRLATIGQALSGVIHDFKTPVTIISGYVQLMATQDDADKRREYADAVLNQFDQLNQMTKEILAFARGESSILLRKIFLHKFAEELGELLSRELADKGVELEIETRFRGAVKMDEAKMKRAIFNLARNASEAMTDGGHFSIVLDRDGPQAVFSFRDTGQGIPASIRESLFESFVTSGKEGGTGLGLAIVKKIVEQHQGTISFSSESGEGTTFVVRFPIDPDGA